MFDYIIDFTVQLFLLIQVVMWFGLVCVPLSGDFLHDITSHFLCNMYFIHFFLNSLMYTTLILGKKKCEMLIHYFVPDDLGGYQREEQKYYIGNEDVVKILKSPNIKRIGPHRSMFMFNDL